MFYVYLIKTIKKNKKKTYVGYTNNINKRLSKHNLNKGAKSTKGYKWELVYKKRFNSKNSVIRTNSPLLIQLNTYLFRNIFHVYLRCKNINNNEF